MHRLTKKDNIQPHSTKQATTMLESLLILSITIAIICAVLAFGAYISDKFLDED